MTSVDEYVSNMLELGYSEDQIKQRLRESGVTEDVIEQAFSAQQTFEQPVELGSSDIEPIEIKQPTVTRPEDMSSVGKVDNPEDLAFLQRCKMIFFDPEKFFSSNLQAPLKVSLTHFLLICLISIFIPVISVFAFLSGDPNQSQILASIIFSPIFTFISFLLSAVFFHMLAKILGGQAGFSDTFKIFLYSPTFSLPLLIPILNILALPFLLLYIPYALAVGFSRVHKISIFKGFIILTIPIILFAVLAVVGVVIVGAMVVSYAMENIVPLLGGMANLPL